MTTRTVGAIKVEKIEQMEQLLQRLEQDNRAGAMTTRYENNCVQIKIGAELDVELDHKFTDFKEMLEDYSDIAQIAVVIGSNDTNNNGMARCYNVTGDNNIIIQIDEYKESLDDNERYWGEKAAAVMFSRHNINANTHLFSAGAQKYDD